MDKQPLSKGVSSIARQENGLKTMELTIQICV